MALGETIREFGVKVSLLFDKSKVEDSKKAIEGVADGMKSVAVQVASAAGALLGIAGISSANSRSLELNSQQLGINVERLQELEYAAKVTAGVSREELTGALEGVSKTLFEARNNNVEAAQSLIRMGVPLSMITNKSATADQVLMNLSERFKAMPDGMYKTALATQTFGAAGAKLIPLLNKGAQGIANMGKEGRSLGVILGSQTIKQGAEFDRQLTKIWLVLKNVTYVIGAELIKYLGPMVNEFQKFIVANRKFIALGIASVVKNLGVYLKIVFNVVKVLALQFRLLVNALGGVQKVSKGLAVAFGVITGAKMLSGIGTLISSFRVIGAILGIVSINALAIGAAFTAAFLIVKDWFSDDSMIKKWIANVKATLPQLIDTFKKDFPNLSKLMTGVFDISSAGVGDMVEMFKSMGTWIQTAATAIGELTDKIATFLHLKDALGDVSAGFSKLGNWASSLLPSVGAVESGVGKFGEYLSSKAKAIGPKVASSQAYMAQNSTVQPNMVNNANTNMHATINVSVPRGTDAGKAVDMVSGGVQKGFHAVLRQTRDQFLGGVAQ